MSEEQKQAEAQKKEEFYDPNTCANQGETGCTYPDCDNCQVPDDELEDYW